MSALDQQVGRARQRLTTNVFFGRLALGILVATALWVVVLLTERLFAVAIPMWPAAWLTVCVMAGIALVGTFLRRTHALDAALAIDAAAGLKERLSTALVCRTDQDPFARAAVDDAERTAGRVHVPACLPYRAPTIWPWSLASLLAALILTAFLPKVNLLAHEKKESAEQQAAQVERQNITVSVNEQLNKLKELTEKNEALKDLAADLKPLEMPDKPGVTPQDVREEAVKRLDKVSDKLSEQKNAEKLEGLEQMKRMLSQLDQQRGNEPGSELSKALANGDFESAKKALNEVKKQLEEAAKSGDPAAKQQLAEMQKKLENLSADLSKLQENKQLQKDLENKAGMSAEDAKKLLDELSKMDPKQLEKELQKRLGDKGMSAEQLKQMAQKIAKNKEAMKQCQGLCKSLSAAAQAMKQCQGSSSDGAAQAAAAAALSEASGQLSDMEAAEQMLNELEANLSELKDLRESLCEGNCQRPGGFDPSKIGNQGPNYGLGKGSRIGKEKAAHSMKPSKAPTQMQPGQIIGRMLVDGPQVKGQASAEARDAVASAVRDATDAIERDEVPRQYERVLREYFDRLAGLVGEKGVAANSAEKPGDKAANGAAEKAAEKPAEQPGEDSGE